MLSPQTLSVVYPLTVNLNHLSSPFPPSLPGIVLLAPFLFLCLPVAVFSPPCLFWHTFLPLTCCNDAFRISRDLIYVQLLAPCVWNHYAVYRLKVTVSETFHSCEHDGISGIRRSGRIQGVRDRTPRKQIHKDSRAAHRPSRQNPSPAKRERVSSMVRRVGTLIPCLEIFFFF